MIRKIAISCDNKLLYELLYDRFVKSEIVMDKTIDEKIFYDVIVVDKELLISKPDVIKNTKTLMVLYYSMDGISLEYLGNDKISFFSMKEGVDSLLIKLNLMLIGNRVINEEIRAAEVKNREYFSRYESLDDRQHTICRLIVEGKKNKQIAEHLFLSEQSVKNEITILFKAMGVSCRAELIECLVK